MALSYKVFYGIVWGLLSCTYNTTSEETDMGIGWSTTGDLVTGENSRFNCQPGLTDVGTYTVQLGVVKQGIPAGSISPGVPAVDIPATDVIIRPQAIITWVMGNQTRRRVSVLNGTTISGNAQSVVVEFMDTLTPVMVAAYGPNAFLGVKYSGVVQIVPGIRPTIQQPPTLEPDRYTLASTGASLPYISSVTLAAADSISVPIPIEDGVNSVYVTAYLVSPTTQLEGEVSVLQVSGAATQKIYSPFPAGWVPLSPSSTYVGVVNNSSNNVRISITFGVDG